MGRRVVYVLRSFPEPSETFVVREIEALRRAGVPVSVLAGWRAGGSVPAGLDVRWLHRRGLPVAAAWGDLKGLEPRPRRWARALRLGSMAAAAKRSLPPDTWRLHAHFANDAAALARYLSSVSGVPYRITAHAYDLFRDPFLLDPNLRGAERIYTVSEANLHFLRERAPGAGWDRERMSVLRCGVDLAEFSYRDPPPPRRPARLLCPARLVPKKGHAVLLEAVRTLMERGSDVRLELAGDGPLEAEVRARIASLGLEGRVDLLGSIPAEEVRERMSVSDVVVLASRVAEDGDRDGLPVALIEALALGVPAVSTRVAGIPELLTRETGRTVEPDRADLLAAAIAECLSESLEGRIARARAGRRAVEREFDVRRQVEELRPAGDGIPCGSTEGPA